MLKRNLIIVAVISLSVFLTSNAFGQNNKRKRTTTKPKVATTTNSNSLRWQSLPLGINKPKSATNAGTTNPTAQQSGRYANDDIGTYPNIISKKPTTNAKTTNPNPLGNNVRDQVEKVIAPKDIQSGHVIGTTPPNVNSLVKNESIEKKTVKAKSTVTPSTTHWHSWDCQHMKGKNVTATRKRKSRK